MHSSVIIILNEVLATHVLVLSTYNINLSCKVFRQKQFVKKKNVLGDIILKLMKTIIKKTKNVILIIFSIIHTHRLIPTINYNEVFVNFHIYFILYINFHTGENKKINIFSHR